MTKRDYAQEVSYHKCLASQKSDCINYEPDPYWGDDTCTYSSGIGYGITTHTCLYRAKVKHRRRAPKCEA
jgi:hypothetical protein